MPKELMPTTTSPNPPERSNPASRKGQSGSSSPPKEVGFFRLLASIHVEPDHDAVCPDDWDTATQGKWRRPSKQFFAGEVVKSTTDLVAKFGPQKFVRVGESRGFVQPGTVSSDNLTTFPEGQVASGFQGTVGVPEGVETATGRPQISGQSTKQGADPSQFANPGGVTPKSTAPTNPADIEKGYSEGKGYDSMTVDQLKQVADAEEIELGTATRKDEIIKVLRKGNVKK